MASLGHCRTFQECGLVLITLGATKGFSAKKQYWWICLERSHLYENRLKRIKTEGRETKCSSNDRGHECMCVAGGGGAQGVLGEDSRDI